ncbi:hypothetical protein FACS189487_11320 [Campylobacterota bacterium]|nr:hypothetical protein FACS189487_11320 [Campylobacterota bacterium]
MKKFITHLRNIALITLAIGLTSCSNDFHDWDKERSAYTVTFNTNGAESTPAPISGITGGNTINAPAAPVWTDNVFEGWYNGGTKWDFATSKVTSNITLTAKWKYTAVEVWNKQDFGDYAPTITQTFNIPSPDSFADAKSAIQAAGGNYILNITSDVDVGTNNITPYAGSVVSLRGGGTIHKSSGTNAYLFNLANSGSKLTLRNATLKGYNSNNRALVFASSGTEFVMRNGEIRDNKSSSHGGGVFVNGGIFTIYNGTISGNAANVSGGASGGGVYVDSGSLTMYGGTISNNEGNGLGGGGACRQNALYPNRESRCCMRLARSLML